MYSLQKRVLPRQDERNFQFILEKAVVHEPHEKHEKYEQIQMHTVVDAVTRWVLR